jgi:hypothetical protein
MSSWRNASDGFDAKITNTIYSLTVFFISWTDSGIKEMVFLLTVEFRIQKVDFKFNVSKVCIKAVPPFFYPTVSKYI